MKGIRKIVSGIVILVVFIYAASVFDVFRDEPVDINNGDANSSATTTIGATYDERIRVDSPIPGDLITSPVVITGQARGTWFFEASFPIKILDSNGNQIGIGYATADGDWMTEEFVPFTGTVSFNISGTDGAINSTTSVSGAGDMPGIIRLERDNPSGLPEHDAYIDLPVLLR